MNDGLIRELEIYAAIAEEGGKIYCAELMTRAALALRKGEGPASAANEHKA